MHKARSNKQAIQDSNSIQQLEAAAGPSRWLISTRGNILDQFLRASGLGLLVSVWIISTIARFLAISTKTITIRQKAPQLLHQKMEVSWLHHPNAEARRANPVEKAQNRTVLHWLRSSWLLTAHTRSSRLQAITRNSSTSTHLITIIIKSVRWVVTSSRPLRPFSLKWRQRPV